MFFNLLLLLFGCFIFMFNYFNQIMILMVLLILMFLNMTVLVEYDMFIGLFFLDIMSMLLIMLSVWIIILMWINDLVEKSLMKNAMSYVLLFSLVYCFSMSGLMEMYMFFEFTLIPLMLLIVFGGFNPERLGSSMYMFMYTLAGSLPFMIMMFMLKFNESNMNMFMVLYINCPEFSLYNMIMFFMFLVKMPMYSVHLWLPKAHTEAPVTGSMILAGLMLKLGGYGLYRLLNFFNLMDLEMVKTIIVSISMVGGVYIGWSCLRQVDIKVLIAYSSVCHMSLILGGVFSFTVMGAEGVLLLMLAHGLCSSGLFYIANVIYMRFKTRSLFLLKGVSYVFTNLILFLFIMLVFNLGAPPSMNFFSELFLMYSIMHMSLYLGLVLLLISFASGAYSLYLYMQVSHGGFWYTNKVQVEDYKEVLIIFSHVWPLIIYIMNVSLFMEWL